MPDGILQSVSETAAPSAPGPGARKLSTRHRRAAMIAFVSDAASDTALSDGLADVLPGGVDVRRGGIRAAIATMQKSPTPGVLIVDVSDEEQPLTVLAELADVVEPDVYVLVIGEVDNVDFYRQVTRSLGAREYVSKPLTSDKVARFFSAIVAGQSPTTEIVRGGGLVVVTGVHGGVGATTLAVNLAGHFGISMRRHTVVLDPDLQLGDAAFQLNVKPGSGLRMALESPERIDTLLAERAAQPVADRLHVLAGEVPLTTKLSYVPETASRLVAALRRRYNYIVADVPVRQAPLFDEILEQSHQRVLVMTPSLASVRAMLRVLSVPAKSPQAKRSVIVLNREGSPGGLTRRQVEDALALKVDVAIPDQPRQIAAAAALGELSLTAKTGFGKGVLELSRNVSFVGLFDTATGAEPVAEPTGGSRLLRLLRRRP